MYLGKSNTRIFHYAVKRQYLIFMRPKKPQTKPLWHNMGNEWVYFFVFKNEIQQIGQHCLYMYPMNVLFLSQRYRFTFKVNQEKVMHNRHPKYRASLSDRSMLTSQAEHSRCKRTVVLSTWNTSSNSLEHWKCIFYFYSNSDVLVFFLLLKHASDTIAPI